jgi:hypothetical protein
LPEEKKSQQKEDDNSKAGALKLPEKPKEVPTTEKRPSIK